MTLGVIVSFDCPHCQKFNSYIPFVDTVFSKNNINVSVLPIGLPDNNIREKYYYAVDGYNEKMGRMVISTLFKLAKEKVPLRSADQIADWLEIEYPEIKDWREFTKPEILELGAIRHARAVELAIKSGMLTLPTFLKLTNEVELISLDGEMSEKISKLIKNFKEK